MNSKNDRHPAKKHHSISDLYLFVLFGIFLVFSLLIVVLGAKVFQGVSTTTDKNNEIRSSLLYVANKVRSADQMDSINVNQINGIDVLILNNSYNDEHYETFIYYYNGSIRELMINKNIQFDPNLGDSIIIIRGLTITKADNLLKLSITASDGKIYDMNINLESRQ